MANVQNIIGQKFHRITVVKFLETRGKSRHAYWLCRCDCGNEKECRASHLKSGQTKSCGCLGREKASIWLKKYASSERHKGGGNSNYKHGKCDTVFYKIWAGIKCRCNTKSSGSYKNYGGRGIKNHWKYFKSFETDMKISYQEHVKKFGERNTTIERINNNGNYCKENCRWATWEEQAQNRRPKNSTK